LLLAALSHASVIRTLVKNCYEVVALGIMAGLSISAALARVVANLLFGVPALDPWTYAETHRHE
jgi:hypothetical protein